MSDTTNFSGLLPVPLPPSVPRNAPSQRPSGWAHFFGEALIATGYLHLDEQARVLGLSRSTTWTILHAPHKNSGLPASVIKQMLVQPQLPALVRIKLFEYVDEKSTGMYGHNPLQLRRFVAALSREHRVMQNDGALDSRAASRARPAAMPRS